MSNIQYIKNITAFTEFGTFDPDKDDPTKLNIVGTQGTFYVNLSSLPDLTPGELIIRFACLTEVKPTNFPELYKDVATKTSIRLLRANICNRAVLASFPPGGVAISPQTVIKLDAPLPNLLEFEIHGIDPGSNNSSRYDFLAGYITLHIDAIKYKRPTQEQEKESEKNI
jgi:hypothetical protein